MQLNYILKLNYFSALIALTQREVIFNYTGFILYAKVTNVFVKIFA